MIPVRVRGKQYRRKPTVYTSSQDTGPNKRAAPASIPDAPPQKRPRTENHDLLNETPNAQSPLERLPTEILEMVFMNCLNLSLPRSSRVIGKRLASNHVRTKLFLRLFPPQVSDLEDTERLLTVLDSEESFGDLQSDVLAMSWVTADFVNGIGLLEDTLGPMKCLPDCRIPARLLRGPWSDDKCQMLEWLSKGGARLNTSGETMDEELAEAGLHEAIEEANQRALVALVGSIGDFGNGNCGQCWEAATRWLDDVPDCSEEHHHTYCVGLTVGTNHLKLALAKNSSYTFLYSLLHAMKIDVDWADAEITVWAVQKRKELDPRGRWLLNRVRSSNDSRWAEAAKILEEKIAKYRANRALAQSTGSSSP